MQDAKSEKDQIIQDLKNELAKKVELLDAFSGLTGIQVGTVENMLELCDKYDVDVPYEDMDVDFEVFQMNQWSDDRDSALINVVAKKAEADLNDDIKDCLGIEDFLELSGNDGQDFWFQYDEQHELILRNALAQNPDAFYSLKEKTQEILDQNFNAKELLAELVPSKRRGR